MTASKTKTHCSPKSCLRKYMIKIGFVLIVLVVSLNVNITGTFNWLEASEGELNDETTSAVIQPSGSPFHFWSGASTYDEGYHIAISEVENNINEKGHFIAGAGWTTLWTRDTSYAIELAGALLNPKVSKESIMACTEVDRNSGNTVWLQDNCGHFGGWPNLSDAIVGAQGAWSYYVISGDAEFLKDAYTITKNSLVRAERDVYDPRSGLFRGCSSFMESNSGYPSKYKMNGRLVGMTKALSTNILYYNGYKLGGLMGKTLGASPQEIHAMDDKANWLRAAIRSRLWNGEKGFYAYFEDENENLVMHMEGLGESLLLLAPEFENDEERIESIFENVHRTDFGLPCLWPRLEIEENVADTFSYYHNGRIWPFVQGYWAMAAVMHRKIEIFAEEFSSILRLSQFGTTFAEFYELDGTFSEKRRRQLWSDAGFLSFVYHGLFGMSFVPDGIKFNPVKPSTLPFDDTIALLNVTYRDMTLDIYVTGSGSDLKLFNLDGKAHEPFVQSNLTGLHKVNIRVGESTKGSRYSKAF